MLPLPSPPRCQTQWDMLLEARYTNQRGRQQAANQLPAPSDHLPLTHTWQPTRQLSTCTILVSTWRGAAQKEKAFIGTEQHLGAGAGRYGGRQYTRRRQRLRRPRGGRGNAAFLPEGRGFVLSTGVDWTPRKSPLY